MNFYWIHQAYDLLFTYFDMGAAVLVIGILIQLASKGATIAEALHSEGRRCGYTGDNLMLSLVVAFAAWPLGIFRALTNKTQ
ncbi:hypothetical protein DNI29_19145 [Hymenobacter sediminis]|uniref:hypothetical protein n=1 Tax=Hymenobacter sediminis TaxID=2218621 RepID=UPI000DA6CE40|nr:hypothetical protein [Hymenobacter sediminis]RPD45499.1 hypothetical protein DNI29_19145 [Hymenobacter sediminis]